MKDTSIGINFKNEVHEIIFCIGPDEDDASVELCVADSLTSHHGKGNETQIITVLSFDEVEYLAKRMLDEVAFLRKRFLDNHPEIREYEGE